MKREKDGRIKCGKKGTETREKGRGKTFEKEKG
jgi:hypothetical protein